MAAKEFHFTNKRDRRLQAFAYVPDESHTIKACLVFHHGYAEHTGRKASVFQALCDNDIAVFTYDAEGFGLSEPLDPESRAFIEDYHYMVTDLEDFLLLMKETVVHEGLAPDTAWFIGGYSMGALFAAEVALRHPEDLAGVVLVSLSAGVHLPLHSRVLGGFGKLLSALVPHARIASTDVQPSQLAEDTDVDVPYEYDQLVDHGKVRVRTAQEILKCQKEVQDLAGNLEVPVYVVHPKDDPWNPLKAVEALVHHVQKVHGADADVTMRVVDSHDTDLLAGVQGLELLPDLVKWMVREREAKEEQEEEKGAVSLGSITGMGHFVD